MKMTRLSTNWLVVIAAALTVWAAATGPMVWVVVAAALTVGAVAVSLLAGWERTSR